jgi:tyrosine-protein kinase Etk/Wzc
MTPPASAQPPSRLDTPAIQAQPGFKLGELIENVVVYWPVAVLVALATLAGASVYALRQQPVYTADALIRVGGKQPGSAVTSLGSAGQMLSPEGASMQTELELLYSRNVVGRALETLRANTEVSVMNRYPVVGIWLSTKLQRGPDGLVDPPFGLDGYAWGGEELLIENFEVSDQWIGRPLQLTVSEPGRWDLRAQAGGEVLLSGEMGTEVSTAEDDLRLKVNRMRGRPGTTFRLVRYDPVERAAQFAGRINARESNRGSSMIRISLEDGSPREAQRIVNALAEAYVQQNIEQRSEEAQKSLSFLQERLPELKAQADEAESDLIEFRKNEKTLDITAEISGNMEKAVELAKNRLLAEDKRLELSSRFKSDHPVMQTLERQISKLGIEEASLNRSFEALPAVLQKQIQLQRNLELRNQLYNSMLNNAQQIQIAKAGTVGSVAIIDRAVLPQYPTRPNRPRIVAMGGLLGLLLGLAAAQAAAMLAGRVRDPKKLEQTTGLPTLAIVPNAPEQIDIEAANKVTNTPTLLSELHPNSPGVEALRSLRMATQFALAETKRGKVVLITSAVAAQGKSFISANLSFLLASTGRRTLLIDADVRRSTLSRFLKFQSQKGLSEILLGEARLQDVLLPNIYPNLTLLPSGKILKNPGEAFASADLATVINTLANNFDYIVIDSPPLLAVMDAAVLARTADLSAFVVRQGSVSHGEVDDALRVFARSGSQVSGIIFNGYAPSRVRYGYGYGRRYGYYRYGNAPTGLRSLFARKRTSY